MDSQGQEGAFNMVYVVLVMKNGYLTLKQVKRNVASAKISRRLLLSCGNSKTETPT
jgi:hypothetical protein